MTTSVVIKAHCTDDKEVHVMLNNADGSVIEAFTLQDGEQAERVVFDARLITVTERPK